MAEEYSYNDFMQMQQQAIDRVREMQKKAAGAESAKQELPSRFFPPPNDAEIKNIATFPQKPKSQKKENPPVQKSAPPVSKVYTQKPQKKQNVFSFLTNADADMSLILPILLLLGTEGADKILLLALLYIIS